MNTEESIIPYEYGYFDFCPLNPNVSSPVENLGQVVFGERIRPSSYKIEFLKNETCKVLCTKTYSANNPKSVLDLSKLRKALTLNYQHHWIVDNMPVTSCFETEEGRQYCTTGFPMGCYWMGDRDTCYSNFQKKNAHYIFNHVDLTITYHSGAKEDWGNQIDNVGRIISVKVVPRSLKYTKLVCSFI